jgi:histidinol-phosphatase (PHP family)
MRFFDSHMHTPLCKHAVGSSLEYAHEAIGAGLAGICFTEHIPFPGDADAHTRPRNADLPEYLEIVDTARRLYAQRLEVRVGLEADFLPGLEPHIAQLTARHDWDYIIGSVHQVGAYAYGVAPEPQHLLEYWRAYYDLVIQAAKSGLFDAIGHLDLPKRWIAPPINHLEYALPALDAIAEARLALDFNTSGWRIPALNEAHPTNALLREARVRGIPLALGSDAHRPADVGSNFGRALELAQNAGYGEVVSFSKRQPQIASLEP